MDHSRESLKPVLERRLTSWNNWHLPGGLKYKKNLSKQSHEYRGMTKEKAGRKRHAKIMHGIKNVVLIGFQM